MKTFTIPDELIEEITRDDLKECLDCLIEDCNKCEVTGISSRIFSEDVEKEKEELLKYIEAFRLVLKFYEIEK